MKTSTKIMFNIGKVWVAIVLFMALVISTVVSLPFILFGKLFDVWNLHHLKTNKGRVSDSYNGLF